MSLVQLFNVSKSYGLTTALDDVSVGFEVGTFTAVMGPSGSGKSTLLHCAAGLDRPDSGSVRLDGVALEGLGERQLTQLRRRRLGFVFQSYNLIPTLSVAQNVELPLRLDGKRARPGEVASLLGRVGLSEKLHSRPDQLSGGQRQRAAVARALVANPAAVFADEPTGALDIASAAEVLNLLRDCVDRDGRTVIVVTHDPVVAARADRVLFLADGRIQHELFDPQSETISSQMTNFVTMAQAVTR